MTATATNRRPPLAYTDDVRGTIVGGEYVTGRLHYQGRPQGPQLVGPDAADLRRQAVALKAEAIAQCGAAARMIFPADDWTLRIHD